VPGYRHRILTAALCGMAWATALQAARAQEAPAGPLLFTGEGWRLKLGLDAAVQTSGEINSWWNLTDAFPPPEPFDPDRSWTEGYVKPSAKLDIAVTSALDFYGGLAAVASYTWGMDVFNAGNTGDELRRFGRNAGLCDRLRHADPDGRRQRL
jgi:hypothetical protein